MNPDRGFPYGDVVPAVLLTDGALPTTPAVLGLGRSFAAAGFLTYVMPWAAVRVEPGYLFAAAGELIDRGGIRPLPLWTAVTPRLVVPVASMEIEGMVATYRAIADDCPDAVLTWTQEQAQWSGRVGTERLLRAKANQVSRPDTALLPNERDRVAQLGPGRVVFREPTRRRARGGQRVSDGAAATALFDKHEAQPEIIVSAEVPAAFDLRVFALITGADPLTVLISPQGYARRWPFGWARQSPLPSLDGRLPRAAQLPAPEDVPSSDILTDAVRSRVEQVVADYLTGLAAAARLSDLTRRNRVLPWLTLDLLVPNGPTPQAALLDVEMHCEPRTDPAVTKQVVAPLLRVLADRCARPRSVLLPEPDLDVTQIPASTDQPAASRLLPLIGAEPCLVDTVAWPDASFEFCDEALRLPDGVDPLTTLGRVIGTTPGPVQQRFVEPGVGRTCLLNEVQVDGHPEYRDASVLGIGLTPYSDRGYAMVGPHVDGLTSMLRAQMRRRSGERLAAAGCRTARTMALIAVPGLETTMPDLTHEPAALVVRAFRCVLRVKQLDPLATPYLSPQHRPLLWEFLTDPRWETDGRPGPMMLTPGRLGGTVRSQRQIADSGSTPHVSAEARRRREVIALYAPLLVRFAAARLSVELGRDPVAEPISAYEYIEWFAAQLGGQLAVMCRERFLHDYHQPGIGRHDPAVIYSLGESNVTLLAEFVDFDTGVFCDQPDDLTAQALRLRRADLQKLSGDYHRWHAQDKAEARSVVRTLAALAGHGQRGLLATARRLFDQAYEEGIS